MSLQCSLVQNHLKQAYERSYSVTMKSRTNSDIPLPPSGALFYCGNSLQMEVLIGSCQGIHRLNMFLKARRDDVSAGVPSRFLHAVIGPDCCGNPHEPFIV
ncbi:hypothetical protein RND71_033780 [Anisodus tanguticus]|uniref:Uncharacterized protein n=1 Tax=Anisodus tanguticus TaxID=243964 RepID=A0AAE1V1T8_9SOLA|nr:hypothetical protein RND71_033780 [Anisodus tanguticus]